MRPNPDEPKYTLSQGNRTRMLADAKRGSLIPLIGAGISDQAVSEDSSTTNDNHTIPKRHVFPTWRMLAKEMLMIAQEEGDISNEEAEEMRGCIYQDDFPWVAQKLRIRLPMNIYIDTLIEKFNPSSIVPAEIHKALFKLNAPIILTTNYDRLLEDAYARKEGKIPNVYTYRDTDLALKTIEENRHRILRKGKNQETRHYDVRPIVFKIYGSISAPSDMILTSRDFSKKIVRQADLPDLLARIFITSTVLLLGFSTFDVELTMLLDTLRETLGRDSTPDYIFLSREAILREIDKSNMATNLQAELDKFSHYKINIVLFDKDKEMFEFIEKFIDEAEGQIGK